MVVIFFCLKDCFTEEKEKIKEKKIGKTCHIKKKKSPQKYFYKASRTKTQFGFIEPKAYLKLC